MGKHFRIPPPRGEELYWDRQAGSMRWALRDHRGDVYAEIVATQSEWIVTAVSMHEGYPGIALAFDLRHEPSAIQTAQQIGEALHLLAMFRLRPVLAAQVKKG